MDRRAFIASGLRAGAVVASGGLASALVAEALNEGTAAAAGSDSPPGQGEKLGAPNALTVTGAVSPVGVDPDDVQFAWHVNDPRRGAVQGGYRILVSGPGTSTETVWDSGEVESSHEAFVAYGGRTLEAASRYRWKVSTSDGSGSWSLPSAPATFLTGLRTSDWTAQWLRPGPGVQEQEEYTYLRATQALPRGTVLYATAYVAAAHKYQLWVNGAKVDSGPSFCFPDEQYYQATDITTALRAGSLNAVGILHHWYGPGRGRPTSFPGLLAQFVVHFTDGHVVTFGTGAGWRVRRAEWMPAPQRNNDCGDFVEWIDARMTPVGWATPSFVATGWAPATVLGPFGTAPFAHLYAQRTRIVETGVEPVSVRTLPTGSVVADFGEVYAGRPTVTFGHGVAGHTVPMHVGYSLDPDGSVSTTHGTQGTDLSFSYVQRDGEQTFEPYWYLGFRYLQVDDPGEELTGEHITVLARHAAMPATGSGTFKSSNHLLDAVWALCSRSALYCSQEQFIDTPTREKGQFLWDAANESQVMMRAHGDQNLSWQGLRDMARAQARYWPSGQVNEVYPNDDGPQNYPTFTALYPEWVWRYYLSTGDRATVASLLPTLSRLSDYIVGTIDPATGLVSNQPMSTNGDNEYGYDYDTAADTTLNVLAVNAFRRIEDAAALVGNGQLAAFQAARAASLSSAVNSLLLSPQGVYCDGLRADRSQSSHTSQLANLTALAYGVVPIALVAQVAQYVASLDISVEPDHGMELLRALHAGGRDDDMVRILTDASFPGWAAILQKGGTFTWETWTPSDLIGDSMSHGWGSSALVAMQEALLGVVPTAAQSGGPPILVTVTAPSSGLTSVAGTFPTPAGEFSVAWEARVASTRLTLSVPANAAALCQFPGSKLSNVTEGGGSVEHAPGVQVLSGTGGTAILNVGAGSYRFDVADA